MGEGTGITMGSKDRVKHEAKKPKKSKKVTATPAPTLPLAQHRVRQAPGTPDSQQQQ